MWSISEFETTDEQPPKSLIKELHKTIKKVTGDTDKLDFNTAIAQMMIFANVAFKEKKLYKDLWADFIKLLAPYAPHLAEEIWEMLGKRPSISKAEWPSWDEELTKENEITVVVQINGKVRDKFDTPVNAEKNKLQETAFSLERIKGWTEGKEIIKVIVVPNKLVNIVIKG